MEQGQVPNTSETHRALLLTGGGGYLGSRLLMGLEQLDRNIVSIYKEKEQQYLKFKNLHPLFFDLLNKSDFSIPYTDLDFAIHLAWDRSVCLRRDEDGKESSENVEMTKNLLKILEDKKCQRILFVSAIGASRDAKEPFLREKYLCESLIINSKIPEKIIVRSSFLFGGGMESPFIRAARFVLQSSIFCPILDVGRLSPLHVDDLVDLLLKCSSAKMYDFCSVLDLVGGESYPLEQLFKILSQDSKKGVIPIRSFLSAYVLRFLERKKKEKDPKLSDYICIENRVEKNLIQKNPLSRLLPEKCKSFRDYSLRV